MAIAHLDKKCLHRSVPRLDADQPSGLDRVGRFNDKLMGDAGDASDGPARQEHEQ